MPLVETSTRPENRAAAGKLRARLHSKYRRATAAVELAICLPIISLLTFGSIEIANGLYLKQAVAEAAYEAARIATTSKGDSAVAETRGEDVLKKRGVKGYTVTISPAVDLSTEAGTTVTATVTAKAKRNTSGTLWFLQNKTVSSSVVMVRSS